MESKSIFKSKTFWVTLLGNGGTLLGIAAGLVAAPALPYVIAAQGIINIALRLVTKEPVHVVSP